MDREAILAAVEKRILSIPGVVDMKVLDPKLKEEVTHMETMAEANGACGGLMPFVNEGVWEALSRDVCIIIVGNAHLLVGGGEQLLKMVDKKGNVIGEYVPPHKRDEVMAKDPDASFLSDDFCLHSGADLEGEPTIIIGQVEFPYLHGIEGVTRVTSGSISTLSDDLIRNTLGYTGPKEWTHLIGFDIMS